MSAFTSVIETEQILRVPLVPYHVKLLVRPKRRIGHFDIDAVIEKSGSVQGKDPVMSGIYSKGNRLGTIRAWFDIHYYDKVIFTATDCVVLSEQGLAIALFRLMGRYLEPGGMIFLSYITDIAYDVPSSLHEVTRHCVETNRLRIAPACTPLGILLVAAGCYNVKSDGYNVQGSQRLAGEKAPNDAYRLAFMAGLRGQLESYLDVGINDEFLTCEQVCRRNVRELLDTLDQQLDERKNER